VLVRHADDPQPLIGEGEWHGEMIASPRGTGGFGYDPHFLIPELQLTAAELTSDEKNRRSHRARALAQLIGKLAHVASYAL
jgi:XTP/dITP diphosphohydrolase